MLHKTERGFLVRDLIPDVSKKRKLIFSELHEENSQHLKLFCLEAANTIAENICIACSRPDSPFLKGPMKTCLQDICRVYAKGNMRSAICLSFLVHASKCTTLGQVCVFVNIAFGFCRLKSFPIDVLPPECFEQAKELLYSPCLSSIVLQDLRGLDNGALHKVKIRFVDFPESHLRSWCGPSLVIVNVYALKRAWYLTHAVPLVMLIGNEARRALERKYAGNNHNYSTPDKAAEINPAFATGCRDTFHLSAVGKKLSFRTEPLRLTQNALLDEIETSFNQGQAPALRRDQLLRFGHIFSEPMSELDFEYDWSALR